MTSILTKEAPPTEANFTGEVWVNLVVAPEDDLNIVIAKVGFAPKARTHWHSHAYEQVLVVTDGIGYYQESGKSIHVIREGDVVKIPQHTLHWHGAAHNSSMTHMVIAPANEFGAVWMRPVTSTEYNATPGKGDN
ncbi:cupin domain-containing protein [uncultured Chitinophaga sp.]|jgi:Uncharacterized conserved protein, contains double-stranded beta-helix domain|uniref:cupin domain-containing protein n=1 Tax=uncultured Chitinophaga sp. TaxID=339340 RepID=UPI00262E0F94|nr:cupin domain-containing protein [uncultured Chitinophaga sp.]